MFVSLHFTVSWYFSVCHLHLWEKLHWASTDSNGESLVAHSSDFSCHVTEGICIFPFSFTFLVFLVDATIQISKHVCNTSSGLSSVWVFNKMYIFIMYKSCIFKNPCSIYTMKKKHFYSSIQMSFIQYNWFKSEGWNLLPQ